MSATTPAMARLTAQQDAAAIRLRLDLSEHLWRQFPQHCVTLTDKGVRACVETAVERGERHGFRTLDTLTHYASLMVFLGASFDDDPQLPWAGDTLRRNAGEPRKRAMGELLRRTAGELARVAGDRGQHYRRALLWVRRKGFEQLAADYAQRGEPGLGAWLHDLFATKADGLGDAQVTALLEAARASAAAWGVAGPEGTLVISGLMMLLGHRFDSDPFHPWAPAAIERARSMNDALGGARLLHAAAVAELERFLALDRLMKSA
jgi:hypothetical protein